MVMVEPPRQGVPPPGVPRAKAAAAPTAALSLASKQYYLHVQIVEEAAQSVFINAGEITHFAGSPHEALFDGVFMDRASVLAYIALYEATDGLPYAAAALAANQKSLLDQVQSDFASGAAALCKTVSICCCVPLLLFQLLARCIGLTLGSILHVVAQWPEAAPRVVMAHLAIQGGSLMRSASSCSVPCSTTSRPQQPRW